VAAQSRSALFHHTPFRESQQAAPGRGRLTHSSQACALRLQVHNAARQTTHWLVEWKRASKPPRCRRSPMAVRCASKGRTSEPQPASTLQHTQGSAHALETQRIGTWVLKPPLYQFNA